MLIQNLTNPALMNSINSYTKKIIHFVLRGDHGQDYFSAKRMLEALLEESKKRKSLTMIRVATHHDYGNNHGRPA